MRTGQHEVIDIIGWNVSASNTTDRKGVIDMVDISSLDALKLDRTVVAGVLLAF